MATAESKLLTAEEFFDWTNRPENRDRHFELEEGEIVEMSRPGERHGVVCSNANGILWSYTRQLKQGYVCCNDTGLILKRGPDTVRGPDVALSLESKKIPGPGDQIFRQSSAPHCRSHVPQRHRRQNDAANQQLPEARRFPRVAGGPGRQERHHLSGQPAAGGPRRTRGTGQSGRIARFSLSRCGIVSHDGGRGERVSEWLFSRT